MLSDAINFWGNKKGNSSLETNTDLIIQNVLYKICILKPNYDFLLFTLLVGFDTKELLSIVYKINNIFVIVFKLALA